MVLLLLLMVLRHWFNDNLLALLSDSPPGAVPFPTLASVTPPDDLIGPTQDDFGGDDVVGIL